MNQIPSHLNSNIKLSPIQIWKQKSDYDLRTIVITNHFDQFGLKDQKMIEINWKIQNQSTFWLNSIIFDQIWLYAMGFDFYWSK